MGYGHHLGGSSINYSQNECLPEMIPDVDSDNFDLAEVGCEHIMIGSRTCSVPYELYDLPDLKRVLSLETWNHQLNEDERFFLATFLPDMDQEMFWLTVKELLTGDEMLFGSPLQKFYAGMKGGLYSPQVTYLRECLVFLHKNEYYHHVRSYHENMLQAFSEMKKLWDGCRRNLTVEERIHIWKSRKENEPRFSVDLNAFPDEDILNKCDKGVESSPSSKKARCVNEGHYSTILLNGLVHNTNRKGKGVLKLKPNLTKPAQSQVVEPLPDKPEQPSKSMPKGVLKIKRKYDHHSQETPRVNLEQISPNFLSQQFTLKKDEVGISEKSPILCQINRNGSTFRSPEMIHCGKRQEIPYACTKFPEIFKKEPKMRNYGRQDGPEICRKQLLLRIDQNLSNYALDAGHSGGCQNMTKKTSTVLKARPNISIEEHSAGTKKCHLRLEVEYHSETSLTTTTTRIGLLISDVRSDKHVIQKSPSELVGNGSKIDRGNVAVSGAEKCPMFPITYKRKKPYKKVYQKDTLKQQPQESVAVCLDSSTPSGAVKPKPMAIKIKFRGSTGQSG